MTKEENALLRGLLEKKMAEYRNAIEVVEEHCDDPEEAYEETRHLRNALRHARNFSYQIREAEDNWVEATLDHVNFEND